MNHLPRFAAHAAFAVLAAQVLVLAGQPIYADDLWWHLALGRSYAAEGPRLEADPLLHTAAGPPAPAAWLTDLALFGVWDATGFAGLRLVHVLAVAAIIGLAWSLLRRASGSPLAASLGTAAFLALATWRLAQLRPHLFSILATLLLYRLLVEGGAPPSPRRVAVAVGVLAVWANAHGAFLLGPILLATALAATLVALPLRPVERRSQDATRARRLAAALGLGLLATLLTPEGAGPDLSALWSGDGAPALGRLVDEWVRLDPFRVPPSWGTPSRLAWGLAWALLVATPLAAVWAVARWRRGVSGADAEPGLVAFAGASLVALLLAVRFLWLGLFPLLLLSHWVRLQPGSRQRGARAGAWAAAAAAWLIVLGFTRAGDWPMLAARIVSGSPADYAQPYPAEKYFAHGAWVLGDAGLTGNLFNEYFVGGFLGFWLAPELRGFVNGTLNFPPQVIAATRAIRERRGAEPGESFLELLDRQRVDLFYGLRLPRIPDPNVPWFYTTGHLEGAPGWLPIFRNLRSAVYLRANEGNRANLERVARYYAGEGVPFDPAHGFDAARAIEEAPGWAVRRGLVPAGFEALAARAESPDAAVREPALDRLASLYTALGLYERALRIDRRRLAEDPAALPARRRLVWALLRQGRRQEALVEALELVKRAPEDWLGRRIGDAVYRAAHASDPEEAAAVTARVPVFDWVEGPRLLEGVAAPEARTAPRRAGR